MKLLFAAIALTLSLPLSAHAGIFNASDFIPCMGSLGNAAVSPSGHKYCLNADTGIRAIATSDSDGEVGSLISGVATGDGFIITYTTNDSGESATVLFDSFGQNTKLSGEYFPTNMPAIDYMAIEEIYGSLRSDNPRLKHGGLSRQDSLSSD